MALRHGLAYCGMAVVLGGCSGSPSGRESAVTFPTTSVASLAQTAVQTAGTISRESYIVTFPLGVGGDAQEIDRLADLTIGELSEAFSEWDVRKLLRTSHLQIIVHATPTADASVGTATLHTETDADGYRARLDLLAPSQFPADAKNIAGEPKDETYHHQILLHEISTIVFERVTSAKPAGWRFHSAPNWFVQGLEQYTAFRLVPERLTLQKYIQRVRSDPKIVQTGPGLNVTEPYLGGTVLVAFMEQKYGFEGLKRLMSVHKELLNKPCAKN